MAHMKQLEQELKEGESLVYGNPEGTAEGTPPAEEAPTETVELEAPVTPETEDEPVIEQPAIPATVVDETVVDDEEGESAQPGEQKPARTNWKKRFVNHKASSDTTIHGLRLENSSLRENNKTLIDRVGALEAQAAKAAPSVDIFDGLFTDEEKTIVGEDAINTFKKAAIAAAEAQAKPLRDQLKASQDALSKQEDNRVEQGKTDLHNEFMAKLEILVPDYAAINVNPAFAQFMKTADEASGLTKEYIFRNAQANSDVSRVADFFKQFKAATAPPKNPLEKKVTPSAAGAGGQVQETIADKPLSPQEILQFYEDVSQGLYDKKVKLRDQIEQKIDAQLRAAATA